MEAPFLRGLAIYRWVAWAWPQPTADRDMAVEAFAHIGSNAKTLILKGARAVMNPKPADLSGLFGGMAEAWDRGFEALNRLR